MRWREVLSRFAYTTLFCLLMPFILLRLLWRGRLQPGYRQDVAERFGCYRISSRVPVIWLHAVSVGETRAAAPLVALLRQRYPGHRIVMTHMTPTGRETSALLYGDTVERVYLPYDLPWLTRRFFRHFQPQFGLIMETEIWPNLIHAAVDLDIPVLLVNARLSARSARGYGRLAWLIRPALARLTAVAAQSEADAQRLLALGARRVAVCGNIKFDISAPAEMLTRGARWREQWGRSRPVLLAASTRDGEEALLLDAWSAMPRPADVVLLIVPRHPQRFGAVAELLRARGLAFQLRSENRALPAHVQIILGDSMGEMFAYYAACDVAIIGGSLLELGGQNLIEAAACGKPAILGPHMFNFAEASSLAMQAGAAVQVKDAREMFDTAFSLLQDSLAYSKMSKAAQGFSSAHRGAADRISALFPH